MCSIAGIKVLLFIENFIFWLIGSGLLGIGVYLLVATSLPGILQFLQGATTLCYIAIGAGSFLFILGLLGCCGAAHHNDCLLRSYILVLVLFILAEIGIGIYVGLGFGSEQLEKIWDASDEQSKEVVYSTFKCCGFNNQFEAPGCLLQHPTFQVGCYSKLKAALEELDIVLICVAAAVALLQLLAIIMSCFLACNKKEYVENQVMPMQTRGGYDNGGYR
ncbi:leukocyte surface antigen CD53-like [Strongylocentrotus purpuratus]|uniref:Tetraspanin n=1 Tax=Strongylocentrotus purpuratus TaxID=7668 RepID=A0A7M7N2L9_STRPU|nr:leukocyte surface antigen CD53-like [Strongylocentrotus purpuratus]XP_030830278.1 leukocyte surface antigen CD53-like [Strongylocentrotus purpuratus]